MKAEVEVAGETRELPIDEMTFAELELASIQGNELAREELDRRKKSY